MGGPGDVSLVILIDDFEMNENWRNTGRVGYQPIRAQTKRIGRTLHLPKVSDDINHFAVTFA